MARNKEALVLLLDVSPSMHDLLPELERVCTTLVQKKLIFGKSDEVGVVLFGTTDTDNDLAKEVGGYEHIIVLHGIKVVDQDVLKTLRALPRGTTSGDFLDAIVVGMDMLIKKFGSTNKGKQRLCLITSAHDPIKEPFEGTKEDQVDTISMQMKAHGMKLECIINRWESNNLANQNVLYENIQLLNRFSRKTISKVVHVDSPTSLLGALRTRNISAVTIFRGELELSPKMKIKVWVYKKTSEEKFPTLKKYSDKAPPSDKFATHEIKLDFEYKSMLDPSKVVPPEQRIKGYRYGPQVIPISSDEWEAVKFKPEKGVKILGFTDASNVLRHYYMKDVYIFIPEPENMKAILAVSAIARAMKEMNKCAILRCVWRQGQGNVVIGVLTPNVSSLDNVPDSFYFNVLPFAEDVREFQFSSFDSFPTTWQPSSKQQEAADNMVKLLELTRLDGGEILKPDLTPNPVLERFYHFLELKSEHPDADIPPLQQSLKKIVEPDSLLVSHNNFDVDDFCSLFEVKENPKRKNTSRQLLDENKSASNHGGNISNMDSSTSNIGYVRDSYPAKDIEGMLAYKDGSKADTSSIKSMKNYILDALENSYEGDTYLVAIKCLRELQKKCIDQEVPNEFNQFLSSLCDRWKRTRLPKFFNQLAAEKITFIPKSEVANSDATDEDAKDFSAKVELLMSQ